MSQSLLDDIVKLENFVLKLYTYGEPRDKIGVLRRDLRSVIPKVFEGQLSSLCVFHSFDLLRDTEGLLLLVKQFEDKSDTDLTVVDHFALGCSYVALDKIEMAQHHLQIAADLNCAPAKTLVGIMYESGVHFARDLDTAIKFYVDATNFGSAEASYRLGIIYGHGLLHIAKNFEMAMHYLAMSA
jgi:TPR repeat protein